MMPLYCTGEVQDKIRLAFAYAFGREAEQLPAGYIPKLVFQQISEEPFTVIGQRVVAPTDVGAAIGEVGYSRLVLSACTPLFSAAKRLLVYARLSVTVPEGAARRLPAGVAPSQAAAAVSLRRRWIGSPAGIRACTRRPAQVANAGPETASARPCTRIGRPMRTCLSRISAARSRTPASCEPPPVSTTRPARAYQSDGNGPSVESSYS